MTTSIGWPTSNLACELKQGNSGIARVALTVTKADGSPLDSYSGWTAQLVLTRSPSSVAEITLAPAVTADVPGMRFVVDLDFATALTKGIRKGTLNGDLVLIDPEGERHYPANLAVTIAQSFAPTP